MQKHIKKIIENLSITKIYNKELLDTTVVSGIKYNSKEVKEGDIFVCLTGEHTDGNLFINEAVSKGAKAIITQKEVIQQKINCPIIVVADINSALAQISNSFYDYPSKKILLIGVTGTNGKTTVCYLLESIFSAAGYKTGVIGTINYRYNTKLFEAIHTTPFSCDLQKILYEMVKEKIEVVIMEVSSHSLVQKRVEGCEFDIAIFTNLSSEHLDYHKTMENYFEAKSLLFKNLKEEKKEIFANSNLGNKTCVINYKDEYGKKLINLCSIKNILLYRINNKNKKNGNYPIFSAINIKYSPLSTEFEIINCLNKIKIYSNLIGKFNVENILAAFVAAYSQKIDVNTIVEGIKNVKCIPGRLEKVEIPANFSVIIDYAHTPDALEKVLKTLKSIPHRKLIVVFGCGGDRDRSKRPIMGSIATTIADYVIVTSDNPRTEDPNKILLDIELGIKKAGNTNYEIIPNRKDAIFKALSIASDNDIVLLAGKGHETYQIIGTQKIHFDEREVVYEFFNKK